MVKKILVKNSKLLCIKLSNMYHYLCDKIVWLTNELIGLGIIIDEIIVNTYYSHYYQLNIHVSQHYCV